MSAGDHLTGTLQVLPALPAPTQDRARIEQADNIPIAFDNDVYIRREVPAAPRHAPEHFILPIAGVETRIAEFQQNYTFHTPDPRIQSANPQGDILTGGHSYIYRPVAVPYGSHEASLGTSIPTDYRSSPRSQWWNVGRLPNPAPLTNSGTVPGLI